MLLQGIPTLQVALFILWPYNSSYFIFLSFFIILYPSFSSDEKMNDLMDPVDFILYPVIPSEFILLSYFTLFLS